MFERDSKHSNANSNHLKGIWMQILTIRKGFEAFECKFEPFDRDLKHLNANSNHLKGIRSIRMQIWKGIQGILMQILIVRTRFEAFECKFKPFDRDSKHSNAKSNHLKGIWMQILTIWKDSKHSNANSNNSNQILSIWMRILTVQKEFEVFECKF